MSKIQQLFKQKNNNVLNVYCTAGYPQLNSTIEVMKSLQQHGADLIEIGMPYSDPLADGEVIQESGSKALANGMTIAVLFSQLKERFLHNSPSGDGGKTSSSENTDKIPIILMGYMNPVMQYGFENFCAKAAEVGVDGLILPDLPIYEFETQYGAIIKKYGLDFIFLVTPETSEERIRKIDSLTTGFIYAVSSSSTTGNNKAIADQVPYFKKLQAMKLKNPILVGFGIKDKSTFAAACEFTNGAIIGSAYIKAVANTTDIYTTTKKFLQTILA